MLNGSVRMLAPATVGVMSGISGTMYRSVSAAAMPSTSYYWPLLGLLGGSGDRDQDETDRLNDESGTSGSTREDGRGGGGGVNGSQSYFQALASRGGIGPNSGNGSQSSAANTMHIDERQLGQQQSGARSVVVRTMEAERGAAAVGSSREVVQDYVRYCLEKEGIVWQNGQRDATPNEVQGAMRELADELCQRYSEQIDGNASRLTLRPQDGQESMTTVMKELFSDDEISWGRLVALMAFTGRVAVHCAKRRRPEPWVFDSIVDWVSNYLDMDMTVRAWLARNNGWAGFVEFSKGYGRHSKDSWPQLKTVCTVLAAAVGAVTLGAFMKS